MMKRYNEKTLKAMLELVKDEWNPELGVLGQSPRFYERVAAYEEARSAYKWERKK